MNPLKIVVLSFMPACTFAKSQIIDYSLTTTQFYQNCRANTATSVLSSFFINHEALTMQTISSSEIYHSMQGWFLSGLLFGIKL